MDTIEKIIKEINKQYDSEIIGYAKDMKIDVPRVSTGTATLDWATGGGFPMGRIVEMYGPYSSGKTLLAMRTIANAQKKGLICVFIDAEQSFERKHAEDAGIDLEKLVLIQMSAGEAMFDIIRKFLEEVPEGVLVVDSVASIVPNYEEDNETGKMTMGLTARLMSKGLRIINGVNKGWCIIFINQLREKIGVMFGNPETTPGGRALAFFTALRVEVRSGEKFLEDKVQIGQEIKFKIIKSKICQPHRDGSFKYMYQGGVNEIDDVISLALRLGLIQQGGAWYTFEEQRFQGRVGLEEKARADIEFLNKIKELIALKAKEDE